MITLSATYQQTKRLVDGVNGTYQTVLTINKSVGQIAGTYSCTVGNARGESSRTVVVPGETLVFMLLLSIEVLEAFLFCKICARKCC